MTPRPPPVAPPCLGRVTSNRFMITVRHAAATVPKRKCRCKNVCKNACKDEDNFARMMEALMPEVVADEVVAGSQLRWRKSVRSNPSGNCVELAPLDRGGVAVRNSRHTEGPVLVYTREEIAAFLEGVKAGDFDDLIC